MSYTPGFEELKSLLNGYFGPTDAGKYFQQLVKLASENNYRQFEPAIKSLFEEIAKKAMEDDSDPQGFRIIANLVGIVSQKLVDDKKIQQKITRLQEISQMDAAIKQALLKNESLKEAALRDTAVLDAEKKKILLELLMNPSLIKYFSKQLFNHLKKQSLTQSVSQFIDDASRRADIEYNQMSTEKHGRMAIQLFSFLGILLDLFCIEIGLPLRFASLTTLEAENHASQLHSESSKNGVSDPTKIPQPEDKDYAYREWLRQNKLGF